ncbi:MAG: hypothetical protein LBR80_09060 [Deltaproteobacteria bacterium]|jgi:hypothetical protein|nr:hypothetical protein [Deltaproteobacteria bacterium]
MSHFKHLHICLSARKILNFMAVTTILSVIMGACGAVGLLILKEKPGERREGCPAEAPSLPEGGELPPDGLLTVLEAVSAAGLTSSGPTASERPTSRAAALTAARRSGGAPAAPPEIASAVLGMTGGRGMAEGAFPAARADSATAVILRGRDPYTGNAQGVPSLAYLAEDGSVSPDPPGPEAPALRAAHARLLASHNAALFAGRELGTPARAASVLPARGGEANSPDTGGGEKRITAAFDPLCPVSLKLMGSSAVRELEAAGVRILWAPVNLLEGSLGYGEFFLREGRLPEGPEEAAEDLATWDGEDGAALPGPEPWPAPSGGSMTLENTWRLRGLMGRGTEPASPALFWFEDGALRILRGVPRSREIDPGRIDPAGPPAATARAGITDASDAPDAPDALDPRVTPGASGYPDPPAYRNAPDSPCGRVGSCGIGFRDVPPRNPGRSSGKLPAGAASRKPDPGRGSSAAPVTEAGPVSLAGPQAGASTGHFADTVKGTHDGRSDGAHGGRSDWTHNERLNGTFQGAFDRTFSVTVEWNFDGRAGADPFPQGSASPAALHGTPPVARTTTSVSSVSGRPIRPVRPTAAIRLRTPSREERTDGKPARAAENQAALKTAVMSASAAAPFPATTFPSDSSFSLSAAGIGAGAPFPADSDSDSDAEAVPAVPDAAEVTDGRPDMEIRRRIGSESADEHILKYIEAVERQLYLSMCLGVDDAWCRSDEAGASKATEGDGKPPGAVAPANPPKPADMKPDKASRPAKPVKSAIADRSAMATGTTGTIEASKTGKPAKTAKAR